MSLPLQNPPSLDSKIQNIKIVILGFLAAVLFYVGWWFSNIAIYQPNILWYWLIPLGFTILGIAALTFFTLVNTQFKWFWVLNTIIVAGYVIIFPKDIYVLLGGLGFFALTFWFERRVRAEEIGRADFSIRRVISDGLNLIIYGLLLLLAFNLYYNTSQEFKANPDRFYDKIGESAAKSVPVVSKGIGSQEFEDAVAEFASQQGEAEVDREALKQLLQELSSRNQNNEDLTSIVARSFSQRLKAAAKPYERFFPLIFTLVIIGLLRTFLFLYRWATLLVIWLLFRLLLIVKFFKIEKVPVEVNKLVF